MKGAAHGIPSQIDVGSIYGPRRRRIDSDSMSIPETTMAGMAHLEYDEVQTSYRQKIITFSASMGTYPIPHSKGNRIVIASLSIELYGIGSIKKY